MVRFIKRLSWPANDVPFAWGVNLVKSVILLERVGNADNNLLLMLVDVPFLSLEINPAFLAVPVTTTSVRLELLSVSTRFIFEASPN